MPRLVDKKVIPFFIENGVPPRVVLNNFPTDYIEFIETIDYENNNKSIILSAKKQQDYLDSVFKLNKPYFGVLCHPNSDNIPSQVALALCLTSLKNNNAKAFRWHVLTGSTSDSLRDNEVNYEEVKNSKLLIISNIAPNSTTMKLEKLRDILNIYSNMSRILVLAGGNPFEFCYKQLYMKPNYIVNFGKGGVR